MFIGKSIFLVCRKTKKEDAEKEGTEKVLSLK